MRSNGRHFTLLVTGVTFFAIVSGVRAQTISDAPATDWEPYRKPDGAAVPPVPSTAQPVLPQPDTYAGACSEPCDADNRGDVKNTLSKASEQIGPAGVSPGALPGKVIEGLVE